MSNIKHGMNGTSVYEVWCCMIKRCNNPNDSNYHRYGGRGITVCPEWLDFKNFYSDMGDRPEGMSLDRIDVNGNYEPNNCRWATRKEQGRNTRTNRLIEFNGQVKCLTEWAEETGIGVRTLWYRLDIGWTVEKTLTTPAIKLTNRTMMENS